MFKSEFLFAWKSNIQIQTTNGNNLSVKGNRIAPGSHIFDTSGRSGRNSRDTAYRIASPQGDGLDAVKIISIDGSPDYIENALIEFSNGEQYWLRVSDGGLYNDNGSGNFKIPANNIATMAQSLIGLCGSDPSCATAGLAASGNYDELEAGVGWIRTDTPTGAKILDYQARQRTSEAAVALLEDGTIWTKFKVFTGADLVYPVPALPTASKPIKIGVTGGGSAVALHVLTEDGSLYSLAGTPAAPNFIGFTSGSLVLLADNVASYANGPITPYILKTDGSLQMKKVTTAAFVDVVPAIPNGAKGRYLASSTLDKAGPPGSSTNKYSIILGTDDNKHYLINNVHGTSNSYYVELGTVNPTSMGLIGDVVPEFNGHNYHGNEVANTDQSSIVYKGGLGSSFMSTIHSENGYYLNLTHSVFGGSAMELITQHWYWPDCFSDETPGLTSRRDSDTLLPMVN